MTSLLLNPLKYDKSGITSQNTAKICIVRRNVISFGTHHSLRRLLVTVTSINDVDFYFKFWPIKYSSILFHITILRYLMLAPRKTLWSTPPEVIDVAINALQIKPDDIGDENEHITKLSSPPHEIFSIP